MFHRVFLGILLLAVCITQGCSGSKSETSSNNAPANNANAAPPPDPTKVGADGTVPGKEDVPSALSQGGPGNETPADVPK